jgi:hypothetical protein
MNDLNGIKNKSSHQLILETVNNILPIKKKNCFDQTFQKIEIEKEMEKEKEFEKYQ